MAGAKRDVELVIRARDQAKAAINSIAGALRTLRGDQDELGVSAARADSLLGKLGAELRNLNAQAGALTGLGRATTQINTAAAAVARLETSLEKSTVDFDQNAAAAKRAAEATAKAAAAQRAAQSAVNDRRGSIALATTVGAKSVIPGERGRLKSELADLKAAQAELRNTARAQVEFETAASNAALAVERDRTALAAARAELAEMQTAASTAAASVGGVELEQEALAAASTRTAAQIEQVTEAIRRQSAAAEQTKPISAGPAADNTAQLRASVAATKQAETAWRAAQDEANRLAAAMRGMTEPTTETRTAFLLAAEASKQAKTDYQAQAAATNALRASMQGGFSAFNQRVNALAEDAAASARAKAALDNYNKSLVGTVRNLLGLKPPAAVAANAINQVASATQRASAAQRATDALASRSGKPFLGLRPYELQNLSFQINDIFTQLASGTSVTQTFAQQAGQIAQIFPQMISGLVRLLPALAAIGVVLAPVVAAFKNIGEQESNVRSFGAALTSTADAAQYNAEQLANTAHQLDVFGGSAEDARAAVSAFVNAGIRPEFLERFGEAAQNVADVLGIELKDAADKLATAFSSDYDAIKDLDNATNFLTQTQREHIRQLFEEGRASEARSEAFRIFEQRMDDAAGKARGPWRQAVEDLAVAWNDFVSVIQDSAPIRAVVAIFATLNGYIQGAARGLRDLMARLRGAPSAAQQAAQAAQRAVPVGAAGDPLNTDSERARKAEEDRQEQAREQARRKAEQEAERRRREAEQAAERAANFHAGLAQQVSDREFELSIIEKSADEQAVLTALRQAELQAQEAGTRVSAQELTALQQSIVLLQQRRREIETQQAITSAEGDLAEQRRLASGRSITREEFIQQAAQKANVDLATQLGQRFAEVQGEIFDVTSANDRLKKSLADLLELERERQQAQQAWHTAATDGTPRDEVDRLKERVDGLTAAMQAAEAEATGLATQLGSQEALDTIAEVQQRTKDLTTDLLTAQQANQMLAEGLSSAVIDAGTALGQAIDKTTSWSEALGNVGNAFRKFASDFLTKIAQMIAQQAILNALSAASGGNGIGGIIARGVSAVVKHGGGLLKGSPRRTVSADLFGPSTARYHEGGIAGLKPGEVPAVLKQGEEVLTEDDPRHVANGGAGGAGGPKITIHNNIDSGEVTSTGLKTSVGEKTLINVIRDNKSTIKGILT